jgi:hypothetical protein
MGIVVCIVPGTTYHKTLILKLSFFLNSKFLQIFISLRRLFVHLKQFFFIIIYYFEKK